MAACRQRHSDLPFRANSHYAVLAVPECLTSKVQVVWPVWSLHPVHKYSEAQHAAGPLVDSGTAHMSSICERGSKTAASVLLLYVFVNYLTIWFSQCVTASPVKPQNQELVCAVVGLRCWAGPHNCSLNSSQLGVGTIMLVGQHDQKLL